MSGVNLVREREGMEMAGGGWGRWGGRMEVGGADGRMKQTG